MNMPNLKTKVILSTIIAALVLASVASKKSLKPGDDFPDLKSFKLEGSLPAELAGRVVFVDFWASWCGPCAKSFPAMNELHNTYKERGVVFIAISVDEKPEAMNKFLSKHACDFSVVRDSDQKLVGELDVATMPTTFILDREGKIRFLHNGFHGDETKKEYRSELESLLE